MIHRPPLNAASDIDKIARNILLASKAWGRFPTPVAEVVDFADLKIQDGLDLSKVEPGFFTKNFHFLSRALTKVIGLVDFREKKIYLDHSQPEARKNFVKLHEVGHHALGWQKDSLGFMDDELSIDPVVKEEFEREASYFASDVLFQLELFDDVAKTLPLGIKSAHVLAKKFGASSHATIRRYVERSSKRCAVLVLKKPPENGPFVVPIRDYFQSEKFTAEFGTINWPDERCGLEWPFVGEIRRGRKCHEDGQVAMRVGDGELVTFSYHYFRSPYNTFVFIFPNGEKIRSRTVIVTE